MQYCLLVLIKIQPNIKQGKNRLPLLSISPTFLDGDFSSNSNFSIAFERHSERVLHFKFVLPIFSNATEIAKKLTQ